MLLKDVFDLDLQESAEVLETTVGAVKAALHRGRERLREPEGEPGSRRPVPSVSLVDRFVELFNAGDKSGLLALVLDNATAENNPSGQPIKMGPNTQANEHCNFFGTYFFDPIGNEKQEGILVRGNSKTGYYERCVTGVCAPMVYGE